MATEAAGPCPDEGALVAFALGRGGGASGALDAHLRRCPDCRRTVAALAELSEPAAATAPAAPRRDDAFGRYVVLGPLGQGASGVVFEAFDPELDRRVALKVLRADAGPAAAAAAVGATARLLREAQALARLSHPNVVGVLDVGVEAGRPFLALELIAGETLAAWLQRPRPWRQVLEAFLAAGRGLEAAHQAGVIHRDFKPDNVLVGKGGRVSVADFGLAGPAAAGAPGGGEPSLFDARLTATGGLVGTPAYMAPEQLRGEAADAKSDQYSFCVALYEALYGARPFRGQGVTELLAAMERGTPAPPAPAARAPRWVRRRLLRGLSADPARRYPSMAALLGALARDPARAARRALGAAALAAGGAVAALAGPWQASRREAACGRQRERLAGVWDDDARARLRAAFAEAGLPYAADAAERAERALDAYADAWAEAAAEACRATRARGEQSDATLERRGTCLEARRQELAAVARTLGRADAQVVEGSARVTGALGGLKQCGAPALLATAAPPDDPDARARLDEARRALSEAKALGEAGKYAAGLARAADAVAAARASGHRPLEGEALWALGDLQERAGRFAEAEDTLRRAVFAAQAARDLPGVARAATALSFSTGVRLGKRADGHAWSGLAEASLEAAGGDDELEAERLVYLGQIFQAEGAFDRARECAAGALALQERALGPDSVSAAASLGNLGNALRRLGRLAEAAEAHRRALAVYERALGPRHPDVGSTLTNLATCLSALGRTEEALSAGQRALDIKEAALGPDHPDVATSLNNVGVYLTALGRPERALPLFERALAVNEAAYPAGHAKIAEVVVNVGRSHLESGDAARAVDAFRRSLAIDEAAHGPDSPEAAESLVGLGSALTASGRANAAVPLLERALRVDLRAGAAADELAEAQFALARALWAADRARPRALGLAHEARRGLASSPKPARYTRAALEAWLAERDAFDREPVASVAERP